MAFPTLLDPPTSTSTTQFDASANKARQRGWLKVFSRMSLGVRWCESDNAMFGAIITTTRPLLCDWDGMYDPEDIALDSVVRRTPADAYSLASGVDIDQR